MYHNGKNISFTDRSNGSVIMFLRDIQKSQPLTNTQEYDLWFLMRKGNKHARDKFINANLRYVVTVAKKYLASGAAFEDLIMAGSFGITKAADLFDARLGYRFISFATWYIENEVRKVAYDHIKHHNAASSLDEPIYADDKDSDTMVSFIPSSKDTAPDWHIRYNNLLSTVKCELDKQYWNGIGDMLDDYICMREKGLPITEFADKHGLTDNQMKRFFDIIRMKFRNVLKTAA